MLILDGHKLAWHSNRVAAWMRGERIVPITIDMALTRSCPYKCIYCYSQLQENERKSLSWEVLGRFLKDAADMGVKAISLVSDGESTCHKDWTDFIVAGKFRGIDMAIGTNGILITETDLEKVLPYLTYIRFNISAAIPELYSKIHGCDIQCYDKVINVIQKSVGIKKRDNLSVTIGMQMVLLPEYLYQAVDLAILGGKLGVDYFVIKHCSDDEKRTLGVDYSKYWEMEDILKTAESYSTDRYQVSVKWSKIMGGNNRNYVHCYGPPFIMQLSGSGLVAPCGMLFNDRYKKYHIGNIADTSFQELWKGERYWEVMRMLSWSHDSRTMCGSLCLQHKVNEYLNQIKKGMQHINFI